MKLWFIFSIFRYTMISMSMVLIGCTTPATVEQRKSVEIHPELPETDITLTISGLGPSNDSTKREFSLNSKEPVTVLVHGCHGSAGRFSSLSEVLAFHGQQSVSFSYDDRDSMMRSSLALSNAIEELALHLESPEITIIGHSMGGLIARKALISGRADSISTLAKINLVTVSAPFSGIHAARFSAYPFIRIATLGINDLLSRILIGAKWHEITYASGFIRKPGELVPAVERFLLVATDERGRIREATESGNRVEDDFVFSLEEQELASVSGGIPAKVVTVRAGHIEIVGNSGVTPYKLIGVLQDEGFIGQTDTARTVQFDNLLTHLYGFNTPSDLLLIHDSHSQAFR
jgi:pimeloyl-ACP methyl ester carboxylesterase